jgi:dipeptidyl aminopeptidase/acylaminoacyl peptidase
MQISSDGARVVFRVDATVEDEIELWSAPSDGSAPSVRLSPTLAANEDVRGDHVIGGERAFFTIGDALEGRLYSAPIDASAAAVRLDATTSGDGVGFFEVSPDGQYVVYQTRAPGTEVFLVPADGSAAPLEIGDGLGGSNGAIFTPDGARVLAIHGNVMRSFALDGTGAFVIANTSSFGDWRFTTDGEYLVSWLYFASYVVSQELHSARLDGSAPGGHFLVDGANEWELFADDQRALVGTWNDGLLVVPLNGTAPVTLATTSPGVIVESLALSPDESTAFFETRAPGSNANLWRVPTDASAAATAIGGTWSNIVELEVTPDGATLLVQTVSKLWAVPTVGGAAVELSSGLPSSGYPEFTILPDGVRVVYSADRVPDGFARPELYVQTIAGAPAPVRLDSTTTGTLRQYQSAAAVVAYLGEADIPTFDGIPFLRLYGVADDGSTTPALLSDRLASGPPVLGDVTGFVTNLAGRVALLRADARKDEQFELFAVHLTKSLPRKRLHPDLALGTDVATEFALSADEQRAAFWSGSSTSGYTLWSARTDGSTPAVVLATASFPGAVSPLRFSRDGAHVLFRTGAQGFASVPSDGSAPPTALGPTASVTWFEVDDNGHVVFLANVAGSQLLSAPVDASAPATLLVSGGSGFQIQDVALQGNHAWFRADAVDSVFELVRVPIAGGSAETMSAPMVSGGDVTAFAVSAAGTAVYQADGVTDTRVELFRVLAPGSAVLLTPMPAAGDVNEFVLAPDGARVVFTADGLVDQRDDLFAVPADASAAPLLLATDPALTADIRSPALDPAGTSVAFGVGTSATYALRRVSITGGASVAVSSFVREHRFTPDSKQLVFWRDFSAVGERIQALDLATGKTEIVAEGPYDATNGQGQLSSFALARDGRVFVHGAAETKGVDELFLGQIGAQRLGADGAPGDGGTVVR